MSDSQQHKRDDVVETGPQHVDASPEAPLMDDVTYGVERFTAKDLATLRSDLLQSGLDSFQTAEIVTTFLGGRGYGISTDEARVVVSKVEGVSCTIERLEEELSRVARAA